MKYPLIVFDWDGTLIDSAAAIAICIQEAARELGLPVPTREAASHVIGLGLADSLRHAVPTLAPDGYQQFVECYRKHFMGCEDSMQLFPGVPELLGDLRQRGHRLAIATGKSRRGLDRALATTGLGPYFHATRCADEGHAKPHPGMLLGLMEQLGVAGNRTLMVGDTTHDMEMARAAGVPRLGVAYGAHAKESLLSYEPVACVDDFESLRQWLMRHA